MDPFGYSLTDTLKQPQGFFQKTANQLHIKTKTGIIKNLLLFKKNDNYDSLTINESMRLIRLQQYVQDVSFYSKYTSPKRDSVDLFIRVMDVWSAVPQFELTPSVQDMQLTDNNFSGLGNQLYADAYWNHLNGEYLARLGYYILNIRKTYINANFQYSFSPARDLLKSTEYNTPFYSSISSNLPYRFTGNRGIIKGVELERPFYSPVAQWAGGIFLGQLITSQGYFPNDSVVYLTALTNIIDLWGARSWQLFRDYPNDYITSLILSGRFLRIRYQNVPPAATSAGIFKKENILFAGIGITSRKYDQDKYIFNYGKIEDVPVGKSVDLILGYEFEQKNRLYLGVKAAWGHYYPSGYLSSELEYGTFLGSTSYRQGVLLGRMNYFTRLMNLGNWRVRQFIKPTFILGLNRMPSENLTLNDEIRGFEGVVYPAKHLFVMTLQTQTYAPRNLFGFHFGPYFFSSFGILGDQISGFHGPLYSMFGLGILIRNDYLMFNSFQLSLSFFPFIPGRGDNLLRFNVYNSTDYKFTDFEIQKPAVANYR